MQARKVVFGIIGLLVLGGGWYLFRPERLWVNQTVNEKLETSTAAMGGAARSGPRVLLTGQFHSGAHTTSGVATVYELEDGRRVLRLTGFETSNGPDVQLYLVAAPDAKDNRAVTSAGFVTLGALKGNRGDQNYDLPADVDLSTHRAVTVWCRRFAVNFGTAPLLPADGAMSSAGASMPAPQPLLSGSFHGVAHETQGLATVYRLEDGSRVLRFSDFKTSNGPDVQVYLVAASDASDNMTVTRAGYVPLAALKGNQGDQNYTIPADVDLARYRAVTIWCRRFGVNFATAPLTPAHS